MILYFKPITIVSTILCNVIYVSFLRALEEELKGAGKRIEEQEKAVRAAAPDEKEADAKRKAVEAANKGRNYC